MKIRKLTLDTLLVMRNMNFYISSNRQINSKRGPAKKNFMAEKIYDSILG